MNTHEKRPLYLGFALLLCSVVARVQHYDLQGLTPIMPFGWVLIVVAYQRYSKRLERRNAELEQQLQPSLPTATPAQGR
ncbi:hypothetical protein [Hymenobacter rigui]|uniref:Uncharacterized protein n=1 Tax=Hymenobacter rigui TaxID=334424 RepID=A0A3R9P571_9BACT|nr:hypothetical protein [Hymenobacter rigui]RSK48935.1 hypothetical protein EI291_10270 [Hymenobacter rigui]